MEKEKNLSQLAGLIRQAAGQGAKLIVLPEMCATGYYFDSMDPGIGDGGVCDRRADGRVTGGLSPGTGLLFGSRLPESEGDRLYNTAVLVGPGGLIGLHAHCP